MPRVRRGDGDGLMAHGVLECQLIGMKRDASVGVGARGAIFQVALDGAA